jgi:hypothetical protein
MRPIHGGVAISAAALVLLAAFVVSTKMVAAQFDGVTQDLIGRGQMEYSDAVGGPADVYVGWIHMEPGSSYGGWHLHPGPVWVIVTAGALTVYGPDGCPTLYPAGAAYVARPDTLYDLRNEATEPVDIAFAGLFRAGEPPAQAAQGPAAGC